MVNAVVFENNIDSWIITSVSYISQMSNRTLCSACCHFVFWLESKSLWPLCITLRATQTKRALLVDLYSPFPPGSVYAFAQALSCNWHCGRLVTRDALQGPGKMNSTLWVDKQSRREPAWAVTDTPRIAASDFWLQWHLPGICILPLALHPLIQCHYFLIHPGLKEKTLSRGLAACGSVTWRPTMSILHCELGHRAEGGKNSLKRGARPNCENRTFQYNERKK